MKTQKRGKSVTVEDVIGSRVLDGCQLTPQTDFTNPSTSE